jgi:hypothetical protein
MPANPLGRALRHRRAGHRTLVWARAGLQAPESLTLTSPAFGHGEPIQARYRGRLLGPDTSPALAWTAPGSTPTSRSVVTSDPASAGNTDVTAWRSSSRSRHSRSTTAALMRLLVADGDKGGSTGPE